MLENFENWLKNQNNPWAELDDSESEEYVLSEDNTFFEEDGIYCLDHPNKKPDRNKLHLEIPPQPWQGNPEADVWFLLMNPGYDDEDSNFYGNEKNRNAPLNQLKFQKSGEHWHYMLNEDHRNHNSYSWQWFKSKFVDQIKNLSKVKDDTKVFDFLDKHIFLLQTYGYCSKQSNGDVFPLKFHSQARFVRKLLHWGVNNEKKLYIARCTTLWKYWLNENEDVCKKLQDEKRLIINLNPRNSALTQEVFDTWLKPFRQELESQ